MLQRIGQVVQARFKSTKSWKPLSAEEYKKLLAESDDTREQRLPQWQKRDIAHKHRYGEWKPTKKLSRQQMADIRSLKEDHPLLKTVQLANHYNVSPEAVRRILRSKWVPNDAEETKIAERATKRKLGAVELRQKLVEHIEDEIQKLHRNKSVDVDSVRIASQHDSRRTRKNNSFNRNRDRDLLPHPQQHRNRRRPPSVVHNLEDLID
ncbi:Required for respiratory growth protein 9 mitochondrial [Scheffersomyces spartinae]|uniref:Required for respiratory growth protein 9, mitochondrial n=1 Tax=Scheffersomyces spartinae TaxID=45513 RepID=A0A9P7V5M3_9ASCO|nr:Required for respiratory growth protein 9 mitochondrial [Scheffersomyces spartinae]KAG7191596.1 Required for respiratory growth protein 9 mitochondrial [Scheffersomyces spartinae]